MLNMKGKSKFTQYIFVATFILSSLITLILAIAFVLWIFGGWTFWGPLLGTSANCINHPETFKLFEGWGICMTGFNLIFNIL